jgi:hypothetical protein
MMDDDPRSSSTSSGAAGVCTAGVCTATTHSGGFVPRDVTREFWDFVARAERCADEPETLRASPECAALREALAPLLDLDVEADHPAWMRQHCWRQAVAVQVPLGDVRDPSEAAVQVVQVLVRDIEALFDGAMAILDARPCTDAASAERLRALRHCLRLIGKATAASGCDGDDPGGRRPKPSLTRLLARMGLGLG